MDEATVDLRQRTEGERINLFREFMGGLVNIERLERLKNLGFFTASASTKYHGNYEGGLFDHSYEVAKALVVLTENNELHWVRDCSPKLVGMFHDLCEMDNYRHPLMANTLDGNVILDTNSWEYNPETILTGHGVKSVMVLSTFFDLTYEEVACITYHMGAFTPKEEWKYFTRAVHTFPNVLWTHTADMLASHVMGV